MNRALGLAGVIVALGGSLMAIGVVASGLRRRDRRLLAMARPYAFIVLLGAVVSVGAMQRALAMRDYTVEYVAQVGSSSTPTLFNIAAMWSALEGSILLWGLVLAGYLAVVATKFRRRLDDPLVAWALLTMLSLIHI